MDKAWRACAVDEEVGVAELEANVDAHEFCAVNGVGGGRRCHQNFDVDVRGRIGCGLSKRGGAPVLELSL
jgi:hypothetical protein